MIKKQCPRCKLLTDKYHLMMIECDDCINNKNEIPEKYIKHALGILVLNPNWVRFQESLK